MSPHHVNVVPTTFIYLEEDKLPVFNYHLNEFAIQRIVSIINPVETNLTMVDDSQKCTVCDKIYKYF